MFYAPSMMERLELVPFDSICIVNIDVREPIEKAKGDLR